MLKLLEYDGLHFSDLLTALTNIPGLPKVNRKHYSLVLFDIVDSTKVVEETGTQPLSEVSLTFLATVQSYCPGVIFPFGFNGDGAFLLIKNNYTGQVLKAIGEVKKVAAFYIEAGMIEGIRTAVIPLSSIKHELVVASYGHPVKFLLMGGALSEAENMLKQAFKNGEELNCRAESRLDRVNVYSRPELVFSGPSSTLIVKPDINDIRLNSVMFQEILGIVSEALINSPAFDQFKVYDNFYGVLPDNELVLGRLEGVLKHLEDSAIINYSLLSTNNIVSVCSLDTAGGKYSFIDSDYATANISGGGYTYAAKLFKLRAELAINSETIIRDEVLQYSFN